MLLHWDSIWYNGFFEKNFALLYIIKHKHIIKESDTNAHHTDLRQHTRMLGTITRSQRIKA